MKKLSPRSYQILWDAHAWVGAVSSVLLFAVFFLGAFALFAEELAPWQEPSFRAATEVSDERALELAQAELDSEVALRPVWFGISLPTDEEPWLRFWRLGDGGAFVSTWMHPLTGERIGQRSDLGEFLNEMHFLGPLPFGTEIAGIASIALLLLAGTGLLLQLGRLARELVQFRPQARQRRVSWSDAHKVVGVISLPFVVIFALTGAILCLSPPLRTALAHAAFDGDDRALSVAEDWPLPPAPAGTPGPAFDLRAARAVAQERFPEAEHRWFFMDNLGDANAVVDLPGEREGSLTPFTNVRVDTGNRIVWEREYDDAFDSAQVMAILYGLHFGGWAGLGGKAIYAALSLLVAFGILAGNLLWLERRRAAKPKAERSQEGALLARSASEEMGPAPAGPISSHALRRFDRLLERTTAGACAGLPLAVGAIFLANQLLPASMEARPSWEHAAFFAAWVAGLVYAFVARAPARAARHLLVAAAALLLAVPFVDGVRSGRLPFSPDEPWLFATEVGLAALAALLGATAYTIARLEPRPAASPPAPSEPAVSHAA